MASCSAAAACLPLEVKWGPWEARGRGSQHRGTGHSPGDFGHFQSGGCSPTGGTQEERLPRERLTKGEEEDTVGTMAEPRGKPLESHLWAGHPGGSGDLVQAMFRGRQHVGGTEDLLWVPGGAASGSVAFSLTALEGKVPGGLPGQGVGRTAPVWCQEAGIPRLWQLLPAPPPDARGPSCLQSPLPPGASVLCPSTPHPLH